MTPQSIYGIPVLISPDVPKMQLSTDPKLMLPPAFRAEINKWMVEFFGTTNLHPDGQVILIFPESAHPKFSMNPRTWNYLKKAALAPAPKETP